MIRTTIFISALLILFICPNISNAQKNVFDLGIKGGVNFNKLNSTGNTLPFNYKSATSYLGGAFLRLNFGKIYIQPEGYFTGKKSEVAVIIQDVDTSDVQVQDLARVTSFDMPILLGIKLINDDKFNFRIYGGPVFTTILSQKLGDLQVLDNGNYEFEEKNTGYQIGIGLDLGDITIDGRYENSLQDWNNTYNQRLQLYQISIGIKLL